MATANDVFKSALTLIDDQNDDGGYAAKTPTLIDILQREIAIAEGVEITEEVTSLDDELKISDSSARIILPYGLAWHFALGDKDAEFTNTYEAKYAQLLRTLTTEDDIKDVYNATTGMT